MLDGSRWLLGVYVLNRSCHRCSLRTNIFIRPGVYRQSQIAKISSPGRSPIESPSSFIILLYISSEEFYRVFGVSGGSRILLFDTVCKVLPLSLLAMRIELSIRLVDLLMRPKLSDVPKMAAIALSFSSRSHIVDSWWNSCMPVLWEEARDGR